MSLRVAIYAIAYNEEARMGAWINSAFEELWSKDRVVVADLGSTDKTFATLRSETAVDAWRIFVRPFRFDIARNSALALVPADIDVCICLDIDERLCQGWRQSLEAVYGDFGNYSSVKYQFMPGMIFDDARRVHSRFGWRWRYPAHEGLYSYGITAIQTRPIELNPFIVHTQNIEKDRHQYLGMLKIGLDENPDSCRMLHYYGRELYYRKQYQTALHYLERYYVVKPANYSNPWEEEQHANIIAICRYHCNVATQEAEAHVEEKAKEVS